MDHNENVRETNKATPEPSSQQKDTKGDKIDGKELCQNYGWRKFRPRCLQFLNNPKWFLVVLIAYALSQGIAVLGLLNLVLPSLERRFSFSSKELGIISASNDISALIFVVFISFYGDYANKAKWMGYGAALTGLGVLLFALPHAMVGDYEPVGKTTKSLCLISNVTTNQVQSDCKITSGGEWYYMAVFVVAQLVIGVGNSPYYALIFPFLDEIVEPRSLSTYLGILYIFSFIAPGLGYLIGGKFLSIYVDIVQPAGQKLTPRNPAWIGAWWIGFVIFGIVILVCAIFILGFPEEMPGVKKRREKHIRLGNLKGPRGSQNPGIKELIPELKKLLTNWTYLFSTLSPTVAILYSGSLLVFFSKILREKFGLDPVSTGYALSVISMAAVLFGNIIGSFIVRLFSLRKACKKAALMSAVVYLLTAVSPLVFLIPGCDNTNLAGVTISYNRLINQQIPQDTSSLGISSHCNANCRCSLKKFSPVCGSNLITYIDACHAGCTGVLPNKTYTNCTCIPRNANSSLPGTAKPGYCHRNCKNTILFLGLCAIVIIIRLSATVPGKVVTLRCVPDNKRAFANGMSYLTLKVLGLLPGPIIFGHLMDMSCRIWQNTCGKQGRCFDYDISSLSQNVTIYGTCVVSLAAVLSFLAWYFCKTDEETCPSSVSARQNFGMDDIPEETSTNL